MNPAELQAWRLRMDLSTQEAADKLGLSLSGFMKQLHGQRSVSPQTARITELLEQLQREKRGLK